MYDKVTNISLYVKICLVYPGGYVRFFINFVVRLNI